MHSEIAPPRQISFDNRSNPKAGFDLLALEELQRRQDLDHSPFNIHLVQFYIILFIAEGTGSHTIDFTTYQFRPGTLLTVRKDQLHRFHFNPQVKGTMLLFTNDFLISYLESSEAMKSIQLFNDVLSQPIVRLNPAQHDEIQQLIQRIDQEYHTPHDEYSLSIIRSELQILIAKLYRIKTKDNQAFQGDKQLGQFIRLQAFIEGQITRERSVQGYARMMGLSTKTLNTITRKVVHKSAKAFIDEICILQIKRLLINTELTITEVAYAVGFEETSNFYKYFRRGTDKTPEQFRSEVK